MKLFILLNLLFMNLNPLYAVTTKMFKVLDTCARYRLNEINAADAIEKLKLKSNKEIEEKIIVKKYCSVFTPNQRVDF